MVFPRAFALFFVFPLLLACSNRNVTPERSFYYWKTTMANDTAVAAKINELGVNHFYIHCMDVDWSENAGIPIPGGDLHLYLGEHTPFAAKKYTPVVFITNRTFEHITDEWVNILAARVTGRINKMTETLEKNAIKDPWNDIKEVDREVHLRIRDSLVKIYTALREKDSATTEIQIDCDWTVGTKDKYFSFLRKMKALNPHKMLSATIRLYPYKYYKKMGIPPVDRGMLMCYNMGRINDLGTTNSIFDLSEMNKYLEGVVYPLPLDVALPIFSWQVWFREGNFKGIVHDEIGVDKDTVGFKQIGQNRYIIKTDTVIENNYYREGDEIRQESVNQEDLVKAEAVIRSKIGGYRRLAFFDWDLKAIKKYEKAITDIYTVH